MKWDSQPGQGLQGGVEGQIEQVLLLGVEQLDEVDVGRPRDDLEGGVIIKTSFNSTALRQGGGVIFCNILGSSLWQ